MKKSTGIPSRMNSRISVPSLPDRWARSAVRASLRQISGGCLELIDNDRAELFGKVNPDEPLKSTLTVHDPRFYRLLALKGSIGAAEAYIKGYWSCDDLVMLIRIFARCYESADAVESGLVRLSQPLNRFYHWFRRNTRKGSRENIYAHYDLGNEFFNLFLDATMTYSCGIFESSECTLEEAQLAKIDRICRKLDLKPDDHVLEIGSGWGSFAIHAASQYGCRVTTTTISPSQHQLAQERIAEAGLSDRVDLLLRDYRDLGGLYDKLVSIEMIEAVGEEYLDLFFQRCGQLLKTDGMMLLQAITIADQRYDQYRKTVDFIQRYIFPGSFLPSSLAILQSLIRSSDMRLFHLEEITPNYAVTLRKWRERFFEKLEQVRNMGFSDEFVRLWEFYLCYCEGGFAERYIGVSQMLLTKSRCRRPPLLPVLPGKEPR